MVRSAQQVMKHTPSVACCDCSELTRRLKRFLVATKMEEDMTFVELYVLQKWISGAECQRHLDLGQSPVLKPKPIKRAREL